MIDINNGDNMTDLFKQKIQADSRNDVQLQVHSRNVHILYSAQSMYV